MENKLLMEQLVKEMNLDIFFESKCRKKGQKDMANFYKGRVSAFKQIHDYLNYLIKR